MIDRCYSKALPKPISQEPNKVSSKSQHMSRDSLQALIDEIPKTRTNRLWEAVLFAEVCLPADTIRQIVAKCLLRSKRM